MSEIEENHEKQISHLITTFSHLASENRTNSTQNLSWILAASLAVNSAGLISISSSDTFSNEIKLFSGFIFLLGIIFSISSAVPAYLNHRHLARSYTNLQMIWLKYIRTSHEESINSDEFQSDMKEASKEYEKLKKYKIYITAYFTLILISLAAFVISFISIGINLFFTSASHRVETDTVVSTSHTHPTQSHTVINNYFATPPTCSTPLKRIQ